MAMTIALQLNVAAQSYATHDTVTEYPNKGTYYHDRFEGRKTASGEVFDQNAFTAAHWCIKLGTHILVTNQNTGKQVIVKVNDRCPKRGVIDLSHRAATAIGIRGCQPVTVRLLPSGYEEQCLAQDAMFDSVYSRLNPAPEQEMTTVAEMPKNHTAATQTHTVAHTNSTKECYNLVLCDVSTHGEAYNSVLKLPAKYQDKASVEQVEGSSDLRVSIEVNLPRQQAKELLNSLKKKFPKAEIIPCD